MSIIDKLIIKELHKYLSIILLTVISIFLSVDFFEKYDNFVDAGLPLIKAVHYFSYKIPFIIVQIAPVGVLLTVLIVLGLMNKNNEIIALRSSGVSIYYLLKPVLYFAFIMSILLYSLANFVVPITISKANRIWLGDVKKETAVTSKQKNIWIKDKRSISHIKYYNSKNKVISGISLYYFNSDFQLTKRVDAENGKFKNGAWIFYNLVEQKKVGGEGNYKTTFFKERNEPFKFMPEDLKRVAKKSDEMSLTELLAYIKDIEAEGYDATGYRVDLHGKIAFSFVCVIMCIVGTGISVRRKTREDLSVSIAYGIGVIFLYWIFYSFSLSLGNGNILPPFVAAWVANLTFLCFAVFILLNAD